MFTKKSCFIYVTLLLITSLFGCGGSGGAANFDASTKSNDIQLVSIEITPTNPSVAVNTEVQFTATGIYSDNTTEDLTSSTTWTSSAADALDIASGTDVVEFTGLSSSSSNNGNGSTLSPGKAKTKQAGKATIKASWGEISGSTVITVTTATVVSIAITPTNPNIGQGTFQQLVATGTFSDYTTQDLTTTATWNSSDEAVASISNAEGSAGLASAATSGSTTITASVGNVSGSSTLTVTSATLISLSVTPASPSIALGTKQQFTATGTYSDGTAQDLTTAVAWSSSATSVAAIGNVAGSNGLATSIAAGSTTINATSGNISRSTTLTVTSATLQSLSITPADPSIALGASQQFTATATYSDGSTQDVTTAVTWNSSTTSVAAISNAAGSNGLASAMSAGSATISAASGGVSDTTTLTVTEGGAVTLAWDSPTTNTDGSPLNPATDLSQYKIYYGNAPLMYTSTLDVTNPGTTTVAITLNLSSGTFYFTVTAIDIFGQESGYSNEVMRTI